MPRVQPSAATMLATPASADGPVANLDCVFVTTQETKEAMDRHDVPYTLLAEEESARMLKEMAKYLMARKDEFYRISAATGDIFRITT